MQARQLPHELQRAAAHHAVSHSFAGRHADVRSCRDEVRRTRIGEIGVQDLQTSGDRRVTVRAVATLARLGLPPTRFEVGGSRRPGRHRQGGGGDRGAGEREESPQRW